MRALVPVLAVLLTGCNLPIPEPGDFPRHRPLQARIAPADHSSRQIRFHLSRPAYVAVFEVVPGAGVSLLYPSYRGADRRLHAGWHSPSSRFARSAWRHRSWTENRPRYLYLIASDRPLMVERFARSPSALRHELGPYAFASHDPRRTMSMLDDLVLGPRADQEWTRDVYVQWPEQRMRDERVAYRCSTGQVIRVPATATRTDVQRICARYERTVREDHPRRDTTTVRKPSKRRPEARPEAEAPRRPAARPGSQTPGKRSGDGKGVQRERLDQRRPRAAPAPSLPTRPEPEAGRRVEEPVRGVTAGRPEPGAPPRPGENED